MKSILFSTAFICILLLSIFPEQCGLLSIQQPLTSLIKAAESAGPASADAAQIRPVVIRAGTQSPLIAGEKLFDQNCTTCHSAAFTWNSKMLFGEAEAMIRDMLAKEDRQLEPKDLHLLRTFLEFRLPKN